MVCTGVIFRLLSNADRLNKRLVDIGVGIGNLCLTVKLVNKSSLPLDIISLCCGKKIRRRAFTGNRCIDLVAGNSIVNI